MRFVFFLVGIAMLFAFLMYRFPYALESGQQKSDAVYYAIVIVAVGAGLFSRRDVPWKRHGQYAISWIGIILIIMIGYSFRDDIKNSRFIGELMPSQARINPSGEIVLHASDGGHFHVEALVNGAPILFMVDTGASGISLSRADAKRAGIQVDALTYNIPHSTANGISLNAGDSIRRLEVTGLVFEDLPVSVSKEGRMDTSLLGMTFLNKLQSYRIEGSKLTLVP